jgi:hypothetical protein
LEVTALGIILSWTWARLAGRILSWVNVFLIAMMVVPDWDDAMFYTSFGLHRLCGVLAVYFLLCAIVLGMSRQPGSGQAPGSM